LEGLKKKSGVNTNVIDTSENVDSNHPPSPFAVEIGVNRAVSRSPSPVKTGIDLAGVPVELSSGRVDLESSDSIGPSDVLKEIRVERAKKYEEHQLAQASKNRFFS
jgi:hypothetical protein